MKKKNLSTAITISLILIAIAASTILLGGCNAKPAKGADSAAGLKIINEYENVKASFQGIKKIDNDNLVPQEIRGKDIYYYEQDTEASPGEYYFLKETGKLYLLCQGMWFCVNEDYKNVTPKNSDMYKEAEKAREHLKAESKKN